MTTKRKKTVKSRTPRKVTVDFSDVESVGRAMAKALDVSPEDMQIEESSNYSGFGVDVYQVSIGQKEYFVVENDDEAEKLAVAIVTQDLEESPEIFDQHFIESHINIDRLRRDLSSDVQNSNYERLKEDAEQNPMRFLKDNDIDIPEPSDKKLHEHADVMSDDENSARDIYRKLKEGDAEDRWIELGEEPEVPDSAIEKLAEEQTEEQLKDPIGYLEEMSDREQAVKQAIEIGGIDVKAAAEEVVSTDGVGHFLSSYDGNVSDGPGGLVYWRGN